MSVPLGPFSGPIIPEVGPGWPMGFGATEALELVFGDEEAGWGR